MSGWKTAITNVRPNDIRLRGYRLDELAGRVSFGSAVMLAMTGELPGRAGPQPGSAAPQSGSAGQQPGSAGQQPESAAELPGREDGRLLDAILVSCIDHGATPPSTLAARTAASTGAPMNAALSAGILSINEYHGGAIERCMGHLTDLASLEKDGATTREEAAYQLVRREKDQGRRLSGFGHRVHTQDPRVTRLFHIASEAGRHGEWVDRAQHLKNALTENASRPLNLNVDGAIAALLLELNIPQAFANALFMAARLPGLMAHIHEERIRERPMRRIDPEHHTYDGPEDRDVPAGDEPGVADEPSTGHKAGRRHGPAGDKSRGGHEPSTGREPGTGDEPGGGHEPSTGREPGTGHKKGHQP